MPWFKVDDGFYDHPKVLAAGNAAIGLWTRCGSYASNQLTNGFVPRSIAERFGSKPTIERLVETGLWTTVDGGYQMHDFLDYNPTSEQVKHRRRKTAERVAEWRKNNERNAVTNDERNAVSNAPPDPTRPDPTPSYLHPSSTSTVEAHRPLIQDDLRTPLNGTDPTPISAYLTHLRDTP